MSVLIPSAVAQTEAHADEQGHSDHRDDGCSPFCSCQCCSLKFEIVQLFENHVGKKVSFQLATSMYVLDAPAIDNYPNQIWQPPKYIA